MIELGLAALACGLLMLPARSSSRARLEAIAGGAVRVSRQWQRRLPRKWRPGPVRARFEAADGLRLAANSDLLAACLLSGLPVAEALRAVAGGMPADAADALRRTSELIALGADPEEAWRPACGCPSLVPLARAARRTARSGTAMAGVASELAIRTRAQLGEAAEARAQRAGVLITGPLGLCFLPGFLCLGVVPVVIGLAGQLTVMP